MEELINQVKQRVGLDDDKARKAVETVVGYLKTKLPQPLAGQLENALQGAGASGLAAGLGNMFDKTA